MKQGPSWGKPGNFNSRPYVRGDPDPDGDYNTAGDFNSRPYVRGDRGCGRGAADRRQFQFTPLREGRHSTLADSWILSIDFNSRPYVRGDSPRRTVKWKKHYFNSRPYVRGDPGTTSAALSHSLFQFTPLREGRLGVLSSAQKGIFISIHAPT